MLWYLPDDYLLAITLWLILLGVGCAVLLRLRRKVRRREAANLFWVHAGLSVWLLLAVVTLCELAFALFVDHSDAFNMTNISKRWFARHVDGQLNSFGARDAAEFPRTVPDGTQRICFIGDSFTVGHGIPNMADRFSDVIGAELENALPGQYVVANLGSPGLETSMIEARVHGLLDEGYDVDMVVYVMCLNDIEGYDPRTKEMITRLQQLEPRNILFTRTYFLNWLYFRFIQFHSPEVRTYFGHLLESYRSAAWEGLRRKLDELHAHCRSHDVDFRMVIFPFMQNLGPEYGYQEVHTKLVEYCRKAGIPVLDLEPAFREHSEENLTVNPFDAHPNERANEIAAEAILRQLLGDLLQPTEKTSPSNLHR
jgi:hypothetical protein